MQLNAALLVVALCAIVSLAGARRVKQRRKLGERASEALLAAEGTAPRRSSAAKTVNSGLGKKADCTVGQCNSRCSGGSDEGCYYGVCPACKREATSILEETKEHSTVNAETKEHSTVKATSNSGYTLVAQVNSGLDKKADCTVAQCNSRCSGGSDEGCYYGVCPACKHEATSILEETRENSTVNAEETSVAWKIGKADNKAVLEESKMNSTVLPPGSTIDTIGGDIGDTYTVIKHLGAGSFGDVYKCQSSSGQLSAIKLMKETTPQSADDMNREIRVTKTLNANTHCTHALDSRQAVYARHPAQSVLGVLVLEFAPYGTVETHLSSWGSIFQKYPGCLHKYLFDTSVAFTTTQSSSGQLSSWQNLVHADIKPENTFIFEDVSGNLMFKLGDFGMASLWGKVDHFVLEKQMKGTPSFLAPEVWQGQPPYRASDVWSTAASAMSMLHGEEPTAQPCRQALGRPCQSFPEVQAYSRGLSSFCGSARWCTGMLNPDPARRWTWNDVRAYTEEKVKAFPECPASVLR